MTTAPISRHSLMKARRWMTAGLVVSIIGTNLVEGGSSGAVALGLLPVVWLAVLSTSGELVSFASPLIARIVARFNPARVLVASDAAEAAVSAVALIALFVFPDFQGVILAGYLLVAVAFPAVTDIVEELYGQQLAQLDVNEAMTFNASIYSIMSFIGLVVAMPLGSVIAGISIIFLIAANVAFSALGAAFRLVSARTVITPPAIEQDLEDFDTLGARVPLGQFIRDLATTGAASPLVSFLLQAGATVGGVFVYIAIADAGPFSSSTSLGLVIASFGVGATAGPWIGKFLSRNRDLLGLVSVALLVTSIFLIGVAGLFVLIPMESVWFIGLLYAFFIGILSRVRAVLITTARQRDFRGARFSRLMSWSFAATALGVISGSWLAILIDATINAAWALTVYSVFVIAAMLLVTFHRRRSGSSNETCDEAVAE
ncbi:MAG: MFS transporter [Microcella sp.]